MDTPTPRTPPSPVEEVLCKMEALSTPGGALLGASGRARVTYADLRARALDTIMLYFGAAWCGSCAPFEARLRAVYRELVASHKVEVVYVSMDIGAGDFARVLARAPWLAVPLEEAGVEQELTRAFGIRDVPALVIVRPGPGGARTDGHALILRHGAAAYPYTADVLAPLERADALAVAQGRTLSRAEHPHPLRLALDPYGSEGYWCDACGAPGAGLTWHCKECKYDAHPSCAEA